MKEQKASRATGILSTTFGEGRPQTDTVTDFSLLAVSTINQGHEPTSETLFLGRFLVLKPERRGGDRKGKPILSLFSHSYIQAQTNKGKGQLVPVKRERGFLLCWNSCISAKTWLAELQTLLFSSSRVLVKEQGAKRLQPIQLHV